MLETAGPVSAGPRAYLRIGGITLARHQLSLVLALGCERVICIARALDPEVVALQHAAEEAGARFHVATGPRALIGLVTATDELIVLADGLLAATEGAIAELNEREGVWVQPIESGLPAGFERIDLNHAAAGALRIPGRLVEQLAQLPPDFDAMSALQRIALQTGVGQAMLPPVLHDTGAWRLIRDEAEAHAAEAEWIKTQTSSSAAAGPTDQVVRGAVRSFGPALLHAGRGGNSVAIAAFVLLLLALALGWFGFAATAFVLVGIAWAVRRGAAILLDIEGGTLRLGNSPVPREALFGWIVDAAFVALIAWNMTGAAQGSGFLARAFPAAMLLVMLRLVPRAIEATWTAWLHDRALAGVALAALAAGGLPMAAIAGLAAILALVGVTFPARPDRLTRA